MAPEEQIHSNRGFTYTYIGDEYVDGTNMMKWELRLSIWSGSKLKLTLADGSIHSKSLKDWYEDDKSVIQQQFNLAAIYLKAEGLLYRGDMVSIVITGKADEFIELGLVQHGDATHHEVYCTVYTAHNKDLGAGSPPYDPPSEPVEVPQLIKLIKY